MNLHTVPSLLTPEQTAAFLCVSEHTLAVWRSTGRYNLPYIKVGRQVRYKGDDVSDFIERRKRGNSACGND